jgi:ATP-binding cassette subfamily B protein
MFGPPVGFGSGPGSGQAAASAGLPHAEVPGNLRERVAAVLVDEPEHGEPEVSWSHHDWDRRPFGLWRFLRPHRTRLIVAVVLVALETVAVQMGPVLTQIGIDDGITAGDRGVLFAAAAAYMGLVALAAIMGMIRVSFTGRMGERLMEELRIRVFSHMQRQSIDFHTDEKAGVLMTRMTSDIEALSVLFPRG